MVEDAFSDYNHTSFMIEMNFDKEVIERKVYSITDWMNEVGGFHSWMHLVVSFLLPMLQVWSIDKHLLRRLYSNQSGSKKDEGLRSEMFRLNEAASTLKGR